MSKKNIIGAVITGIVAIGAVGAISAKPGDGLTDQQKLEITTYCRLHPDTFRCR